MTLNEFIERLKEEVDKGYGEYKIRYVDFSGFMGCEVGINEEDKTIIIE